MDIKLNANEKIRILNGVDLYEIMKRILMRSQEIDRKKEHFWIVGLDVTQEIYKSRHFSKSSYRSNGGF